jgi:flagellin-like protein
MRTSSLKRNRKGVSPIIATLLLIVIAVAAAVVTYAFVSGFIGKTTSSATGTSGSMSMDSYAVGSAGAGTNNIVTMYMRNTGSTTLTIASAYVNGVAATVAAGTGGSLTITPGTVEPIVVTVPNAGLDFSATSETVQVVASGGTPFSASIVLGGS